MIAAKKALPITVTNQKHIDTHMAFIAKTFRNLPIQCLQALDLEWKGGDCPKCGTPFEEQVVKNLFGDFKYFQPACLCFPMCKHCGDALLYEELARVPRCLNCGKPLPLVATAGRPMLTDGRSER